MLILNELLDLQPGEIERKISAVKELNEMDLCATCNEEVESVHKAMECNICEKWEHTECMKERN